MTVLTMRKLTALLVLLPALAASAAPSVPAAPPAAAAPPGPARRVVTLEEAVQSARAHQPQLQQAQANTRAGVARAAEQRAGLLPQVGVTGAVQRAGGPRSVTVPSATDPARFTTVTRNTASTTWSGTASAEQVLFDPGTLFRWRAARSSAEALRQAEGTTRLDVVSTVRAAYFAARADRDLARVARETAANDQAHLAQAQALVAVGTQAPIAVATARAALASAQLALIQAENSYANARTQLAQAMGLETWEDFEVGDETLPAVPGEEGELEPLLVEALQARPELASLSAQVHAEEQTRISSRTGYLPTVSARATYGAAGPRLDDTSESWTAGLSLTWSIFDGGLTHARVQEADANLDALRAQETSLRTSIRVALEQSFLGVRAARSSVQAAGEAEASAREQLRLAEGRYQAGAGSIIELQDAQLTLSNAAAQRVQAEYNLSAARAALLRALGRE
jgi:outer membrane protein